MKVRRVLLGTAQSFCSEVMPTSALSGGQGRHLCETSTEVFLDAPAVGPTSFLNHISVDGLSRTPFSSH